MTTAISPDTIIGLLLAAGKSTRFIDTSGKQSDKLAALLPHTAPPQSVIQRSAQTLITACPRSLAVLKPDSPHQHAVQALGMHSLIAQRAEHGMGESLAAGARAAIAQGATGVIIMLADLPYVKVATVQLIANALRRGASIVVPRYEGEQGHPVGFAYQHLPALAALAGDAGAKILIKQHMPQVTYLEVLDKGILLDVDFVDSLIISANAIDLV
jgi:molybdenum cofactor cytidylyltransferase